MIIDGRAIASDILLRVHNEVATLGRELVVRAVVMNAIPATESYLRTKSARAQEAGMKMQIVQMPSDATTENVIQAVQNDAPDAVIVQLPLPPNVDSDAIINSIPLEKDADVLSTQAYENFVQQPPDALLPPVVSAIQEVLERANVNVKGKRAVVVGNGKLVGLPASVWLTAQGANVTTFTRDTFTPDSLKDADLVVSGAGSPHLITPDMLKNGMVLIDAGTSESNGALAGDADPSCASVASLFTPVPGGMGPIAVACLFKNVAELHLRKTQKSVH